MAAVPDCFRNNPYNPKLTQIPMAIDGKWPYPTARTDMPIVAMRMEAICQALSRSFLHPYAYLAVLRADLGAGAN